MNQDVYQTLKRAAKAGTLLSYNDLAPLGQAEARRGEISIALAEISLHEHAQGRPLLSAIVIRKELSKPDRGFYDLASKLGLYSGGTDLDEFVFFTQEFLRATACWRDLPV